MAKTLSAAEQADFQAEVAEWIEAFEQITAQDTEAGARLLKALQQHARESGVATATDVTTRYCNTIRPEHEVPYPGDRNLERRVESLIRWNAMV